MRHRVFTIVGVKAWAQLLSNWIEQASDFEVIGSAPDCAAAVTALQRLDPPASIVVIDASTLLALESAPTLRGSGVPKQLVAVALEEDPGQAVAWATAGASGLVGRTAPLEELLSTLTGVAEGKAHCSTEISGALLRAVGANGGARMVRNGNGSPLTQRELEVASLVASGLTNKEIASRLQISGGTVKTHVHNVIRKLGVARRAHVARKLTVGAPTWSAPQHAQS